MHAQPLATDTDTDTNWRYIQGPDLRTFAIHLPTLCERAPECFVAKLFRDNQEGISPDGAIFVSAPIWYLEEVCNVAQVYGTNCVCFTQKHPVVVCDVLVKLGWQPRGDLRLGKNLRAVIHIQAMSKTEREKEEAVMRLRRLFQFHLNLRFYKIENSFLLHPECSTQEHLLVTTNVSYLEEMSKLAQTHAITSVKVCSVAKCNYQVDILTLPAPPSYDNGKVRISKLASPDSAKPGEQK